jgi:Arc/MetJ-type ribon-helix-helix transcriptional regulator
MARNTVTMTISLPAAMCEEVDRVCKAENRASHSELIREALRQYFANNRSSGAERRAGPDRRVSTPQHRGAFTEAISRRAHDLYLRHGSRDGHARGDWLQAEQEVIAEYRGITVDAVGVIRAGRDRRVG